MTSRSLNNSFKPQKKVIDFIRYCFKEEIKGDLLAQEKGRKGLIRFLIKTEDGSYTLKSDEISGKAEKMHTIHGAITESREKFVKPSLLENKKDIKVLDICSGLGYNAAALLEYLDLKNNREIKLDLDMVEISPEVLAAGLLIPSPIKSHHIIKKAYEEELINQSFAKLKLVKSSIPPNINFNIFTRDAREVVTQLKPKYYDAIFLDPFSPSKSAELYSVEFLRELKRIIKNDGIISTYTSAAPVRSGFIDAGFHIGEGPVFGRKSGGTLASLNLENIKVDISDDDERMIALSDVGIPFKDPDLNSTSNEIMNNRTLERKKARGNYKLSSTVKTPLFLGKKLDNDRLGRRVLRNMNKLKLDDPQSKNSFYLICPQQEFCQCGCGEPKIYNSRDRIRKMSQRLFFYSN